MVLAVFLSRELLGSLSIGDEASGGTVPLSCELLHRGIQPELINSCWCGLSYDSESE